MMGNMMKKLFASLMVLAITITLIPCMSTEAAPTIAGNGRLLVGYWHNFDNGAGIIKLPDVNTAWDIINISFGETYGDAAVVELHPCYDKAQFIKDVKTVQARGQKVVLSLGGAEGKIQIPTDAAREKFWTSLTGLIDEYGFDGIDIDLEGGSGMILQAGDNDLANPTTPQIVNFIKIVKDLVKKYGDDFIISMAPELSYVQGGNTGYANNWGAYLPLINAVRDELDFLQVQHYNCGGNMALDGNTYNQGTADFQVAMVDMLLQGFETRAIKNSYFAPLKQEQVVIGVPASQKGTLNPNQGYIVPAEMIKALNYLIKGQSYGGKYKMVGDKYPNLRGIMTWSINWDVVNNEEFAKAYRPFFDSLPSIVPDQPTLRAASIFASDVNNQGYSLTIKIPEYNTAVSYELYENGKSIAIGAVSASGTSAQSIVKNFTNKPYGYYEYSVVVKDAAGKTASSTNLVVEVKDPTDIPNKEDVNGDGKFDINDLTEVASKYNIKSTDSGYAIKYDMDRNGIVDLYDLVRVAKKMGSGEIVDPTNEWKDGATYKLGDIVTYKGKSYKCIYAHTSNAAWVPDQAFTLWQPI